MSLLRMSLSGAFLIIVVVIIRAVTIYRIQKSIFPILWSVVMVRLLLPVSLSLPLSEYSTVRKSMSVLEEADVRITEFIPHAMPNQYGMLENESVQVQQKNVLPELTLQIVWAAGAIFLAAFILLVYLQAFRVLRRSEPVKNEMTEAWLRNHPLRRNIEIRQLTGLSSPMTYRIFHPVILMPANTDWEKNRQVKYILCHEYVHICHFDLIGKLIMAITLCIHWFNPLVWVMYILYNRDLELACDESVLKHFGETERTAYARMLINMGAQAQKRGTISAYPNFSKNAIEERILCIMKFRKKSVVILCFVFAGVIAATMMTAFSFAQEEDERWCTAEIKVDDSGTPYIRYSEDETWDVVGKSIEPPIEWTLPDGSETLAGRSEASSIGTGCHQFGRMVSPTDGWLVFCYGHGVGGADKYIYKTSNGGETWQQVSRPDPETFFWHLGVVGFLSADRLIVAQKFFAGAPCFITKDGGNTWEQIALPDENEEVLSITVDGRTVEMTVGRSETPEYVMLSNDSGENWEVSSIN